MSKSLGKKIAIKFTEKLTGDVTGLDPPLGYTLGELDLAQGKSVTVGNATYGAGSNAVDGNNSTYWGTYSTLPWWVIVDLGEVKKSAGIYLLQSNSSYRGKDFEVLGSNDNITWDTLISGTLANVTEQIIEYPISDYRYIKLNVTSYLSRSRMYLHTFKVLEAVPYGNENAFNIRADRYQYVNGPDQNGPLIPEYYKCISVEQHMDEYSILLTFPDLNRFNNAENDIIVEYDKLRGNLKGRGGAVDSFVTGFTPTDLQQIPNPGGAEYIKPELGNLNLDFTHIYYTEQSDIQGVIAPQLGNLTVIFTYVGVVNP